jgi:hypothetical protein
MIGEIVIVRYRRMGRRIAKREKNSWKKSNNKGRKKKSQKINERNDWKMMIDVT